MLGSLFETSVAKTLTSLRELRIIDCGGLKHIVTQARLKRNEKENMVADGHDFQTHLSMFPNLEMLYIKRCNLLQHIFPGSFVGGMVKSNDTKSKETSNPLSPQPCFPKLTRLIVEQCHKLKYLTSVSTPNDFSNLEFLVIIGATELLQFNETGKSEVELLELKVLIFIHLSKFCQETQFLNVKYRFVRNCPKLSLTTTTTLEEIQQQNFDDLGK